jgi:putative ATP-dependent endonuclease of the OLD family
VVRHFRLDAVRLVSHVRAIALPADDEEAEKYVREAVLAQPELYFASLVILGEGDSEEIVIPRVAKALGVDLDPSFVAFAPLGGRHVNHFWRLLNDLNIPFLTLLDFDLGRYAAGPLRLKYAHDQLRRIRNVPPPREVAGGPSRLAYWRGRAIKGIRMWRRWLAKHKIFFSYPLDLDMMMLRAYPDAYEVGDIGVPDDTEKLETSIFGEGPGLEVYDDKAPAADHPTDEELAAYDYHFKKRSKPSSHIKALAELTDQEIVDDCPQPLRDLIRKADKILKRRTDEGED